MSHAFSTQTHDGSSKKPVIANRRFCGEAIHYVRFTLCPRNDGRRSLGIGRYVFNVINAKH